MYRETQGHQQHCELHFLTGVWRRHKKLRGQSNGSIHALFLFLLVPLSLRFPAHERDCPNKEGVTALEVVHHCLGQDVLG
jgi:hypothetical protein